MNNLLLIIGLILVIIFAPFLSIWAINTLFFSGPLIAYAIPYTFWTWLAIIVFGGLLKANVNTK
jgi:hypothetical protein